MTRLTNEEFLICKICEWCHARHACRAPEIRKLYAQQIRELIAALRYSRQPIIVVRSFKKEAA